MTRRQASSPLDRPLGRLLSSREVVIACGPGGVGKTTTAAAIAATMSVRSAAKVLVLTVDPARRLADALGVEGIGNTATLVPAAAFAAAGVRQKGQLWAAMLDTKESWDALVRRHAPDASTAARIFANPIYQNVTGRFAQSHEYIAMERLYEIHAEGAYDLVVVDTPPTRDALDFLDAPGRMADFFGSGLLRWLVAPSRSRLVSLASRPFYQVADRILGTQFLGDVAEFFLLFQSMYDGFVTRARSVGALLGEARTTFMLVTTLETVPSLEATRFAAALAERQLHLGLLVVNKVLPASFANPAAVAVAESLQGDPVGIAGALLAALPDGLAGASRVQVARVLEEVGRSFASVGLVASRQAELLAEMSGAHEVTATVPHLAADVVDLRGLLEIGRHVLDGTGT